MRALIVLVIVALTGVAASLGARPTACAAPQTTTETTTQTMTQTMTQTVPAMTQTVPPMTQTMTQTVPQATPAMTQTVPQTTTCTTMTQTTAQKTTQTQPATTNPPELGLVPWRRGYDAARAEARQTGKPLLVLFDEVPGCSTVNAFGRDVLSDVVVADAADLFVSVFVRNNAGSGDDDADDRRVLERFGEPAWNNPVVRFIDADERPLAPRLEGADRRVHLLTRMTQALRAAHREVPPWLAAADDDVSADVAVAVYATACFWDGEVRLGDLEGVVSTVPGFVDGHEVVQVRYDAARLSRSRLDAAAASFGFSPRAGAFRLAVEDDKKQLQRNALGKLPLSAAQRTRINSAVGRGENPRPWLSPRQQALLDATACQGGPG